MRAFFRYGGALAACVGLALAMSRDPAFQGIGLAAIIVGVIAFLFSFVSGGE